MGDTMRTGPRNHEYEINAMLKVSERSEKEIANFLIKIYGIRQNRIQSNLHLTIYHARRPLPGLLEGTLPMSISVDTHETRFMVLAPGGENPRPELDPGSLSVGIRLTKRNRAITDIQRLRESVYTYETPEIIGTRKATTAWTNCFGSRHYQPHIQLLRPWSKTQRDLTEIGKLFRSKIEQIELDELHIESRTRVDGKWVVSD